MSVHLPQNPLIGLPPQHPPPHPSAPITPMSPLDAQGQQRRQSAPNYATTTTATTTTTSTAGQPLGTPFHSPPVPPMQQHSPLPSPDGDLAGPSVFPFTADLPGESALLMAATQQRQQQRQQQHQQHHHYGSTMLPYAGYELDEPAYTLGKHGLQAGAYRFRTEDGLATPSGELKWQPTSASTTPSSNTTNTITNTSNSNNCRANAQSPNWRWGPTAMNDDLLLFVHDHEAAVAASAAVSAAAVDAPVDNLGLDNALLGGMSDPLHPESWENFMNDDTWPAAVQSSVGGGGGGVSASG